MRRLSVGVSLVLLTILAAACSRAPASAPSGGFPGQAPDSPPSVPPPSSASPALVLSEAAALFPAQDTGLSYGIREHGASDFTPVQEYLLREGNRAIAVTKGRPYAVWEIRPDGVWRGIPKRQFRAGFG